MYSLIKSISRAGTAYVRDYVVTFYDVVRANVFSNNLDEITEEILLLERIFKFVHTFFFFAIFSLDLFFLQPVFGRSDARPPTRLHSRAQSRIVRLRARFVSARFVEPKRRFSANATVGPPHVKTFVSRSGASDERFRVCVIKNNGDRRTHADNADNAVTPQKH